MPSAYYQNIEREKRAGRLTIRLAAIMLACAVLLVMVVAPPVTATTNDDLTDAKARQSELEAERLQLEKDAKQLEKSKNKLEGKLSWLNGRSDEQKKIYQEKNAQLQAAVQSMEDAYTAYAAAIEDLQSKQKQYVERMQAMYEHRHQSILEYFSKRTASRAFSPCYNS